MKQSHYLSLVAVVSAVLGLTIAVLSGVVFGENDVLEKKVTLISAVTAISAILLAVVAYVREKDIPLFATSVLIGLVAVIWQYLIVGIVIAIVLIVVAGFLFWGDWA